MAWIHIPMPWGYDDKPIRRVTKKVEDFRQNWLLLDIGETSSFCNIPEAPPMKHNGWSSE